MKPYRPKNWKSPYKPHRYMDTGCRAPEGCEGCDAEVFEAGADAMLTGLLEQGSYMTPEQMELLAPDRKYPYGWLIFIPVDA